MPPVITRAQLLHAIGDLTPHGRRTILVAIDGWGGAGKSTLARWLAEQLQATVVASDEFSRPAMSQWDWARFEEQVLTPLLENRPARYQRYDWDRDALAEWHHIEPGGIVIAEGVSISRRELGDPWDLKVWVECPYQVRLARVTVRDQLPTEGAWIQDWVTEEELYVREQRPNERADLIVLGHPQRAQR